MGIHVGVGAEGAPAASAASICWAACCIALMRTLGSGYGKPRSRAMCSARSLRYAPPSMVTKGGTCGSELTGSWPTTLPVSRTDNVTTNTATTANGRSDLTRVCFPVVFGVCFHLFVGYKVVCFFLQSCHPV